MDKVLEMTTILSTWNWMKETRPQTLAPHRSVNLHQMQVSAAAQRTSPKGGHQDPKGKVRARTLVTSLITLL